MDDSFNDPANYRARVMLGVLNATVVAGQIEGAESCVVDLPTALDGMCDAIVMLVAAAGVDKTPKERRDTADLCRKRILYSSNEAARRVAAGEELPWTMDAMGEMH